MVAITDTKDEVTELYRRINTLLKHRGRINGSNERTSQVIHFHVRNAQEFLTQYRPRTA